MWELLIPRTTYGSRICCVEYNTWANEKLSTRMYRFICGYCYTSAQSRIRTHAHVFSATTVITSTTDWEFSTWTFSMRSTGVDKAPPQWPGKKRFFVKIEGLSSFTWSVLKSSDICTRLRLTRLTFDFEHHLLLLLLLSSATRLQLLV